MNVLNAAKGLFIGLVFLSLALPVFAQELEADPALLHMPPKKVKIQKPFLQGNVTTLDNAIVQEKETVDWYHWYLTCRQYLADTGGLGCPVGTMIRFNKSGRIQAVSQEPSCLISVAQKVFPLPSNTKLTAVLLPVRSGGKPPASPEELYHYVKEGQ